MKSMFQWIKVNGFMLLTILYLLGILLYILRINIRLTQDYIRLENAPSKAEIFKSFSATSFYNYLHPTTINPGTTCKLFLFFPTDNKYTIHYWNSVLSNHNMPDNITSCNASLISQHLIGNNKPLYNLYSKVSYNAALTFSNLIKKNQILIENGKWNRQIFLPINNFPVLMAHSILSQKL